MSIQYYVDMSTCVNFFVAMVSCVSGMDEDVRLGLQDQLVDLIMRVLVRHDELHYYQVSSVAMVTGINCNKKTHLNTEPTDY